MLSKTTTAKHSVALITGKEIVFVFLINNGVATTSSTGARNPRFGGHSGN